MTVYVMAFVKVKDPAWIEDYVPNVEALVQAHGGRYLVRDTEVHQVEGGGAVPDVAVIIEFPSADHAQAFYEDPQYQPYLDARKAGADTTLVLVEGL